MEIYYRPPNQEEDVAGAFFKQVTSVSKTYDSISVGF